MRLSKKRAIKLFREHWKWLAETGSNRKDDWPGWDFDDDYIEHCCFLCEYAKGRSDHDCRKCPIDWGVNYEIEDGSGQCSYADNDTWNYYGKWDRARTVKTRKKYAKIISELPELEL